MMSALSPIFLSEQKCAYEHPKGLLILTKASTSVPPKFLSPEPSQT